jgi:YegS/Rv2252/BmrU family lipid kinase
VGLDGETLFSERPGHVAELARRAAERGASPIVVVGGDGTVNEAVNGLLALEDANRPELAILPRGTGDDLARTFGLPTEVEEAARVAAGGGVRTIDAGRAQFTTRDGSRAERYFANFAGAGISGAIALRGAATSRRLGARAAYFWATIAVFARWRSAEMTLEAGEERRQGRMYEVLVANGAYAAGGMRVAPDAEPDDGLFDVVVIGDVTKPDFLTTFPKIYRGTHIAHPKIDVFRAPSVSIDAARRLPIVLDGEQPGTTPASFEVLPGVLRLRVPAD